MAAFALSYTIANFLNCQQLNFQDTSNWGGAWTSGDVNYADITSATLVVTFPNPNYITTATTTLDITSQIKAGTFSITFDSLSLGYLTPVNLPNGIYSFTYTITRGNVASAILTIQDVPGSGSTVDYVLTLTDASDPSGDIKYEFSTNMGGAWTTIINPYTVPINLSQAVYSGPQSTAQALNALWVRVTNNTSGAVKVVTYSTFGSTTTGWGISAFTVVSDTSSVLYTYSTQLSYLCTCTLDCCIARNGIQIAQTCSQSNDGIDSTMTIINLLQSVKYAFLCNDFATVNTAIPMLERSCGAISTEGCSTCGGTVTINTFQV